MAIEVELPDGSVVEFPDGTDNATMERALAQYAKKPAAPAAPDSTLGAVAAESAPRERQTDTLQIATPWKTYDTGFQLSPTVTETLIGAGRGLTDLGQGAKQLALNVGAKIGLGDEATAAAYNADVADEERLYDKGMAGSTAAWAGRMGGQIVGTLPAAGLGWGARTLGTAAKTGALQGAIGGLLQPDTDNDGNYFGDKVGQVATGATVGAAGGAGIKKLGDAVVGVRNLPRRMTNAVLAPEAPPANAGVVTRITSGSPAAIRRGDRVSELTGIDLSPGQRSGGKAATMLENVARGSMWTRDKMFAGDQMRARQMLNAIRRTARDIAPNGQSPEAFATSLQERVKGMASELANARSTFGRQAYGSIEKSAGGGKIVKTDNVQDEIARIVQDHENVLGADSSAIAAQAEGFFNKLKGDGAITPTAALRQIQAWEQAARTGTGLFEGIQNRSAAKTIAGQLSRALMKDLDAAADGAGGTIGESLRAANKGWREYSQQIDALEASALGRIVGDDFADEVAGVTFNKVSPEKVWDRLDGASASELNAVKQYLLKADPEKWWQYQRLTLERARDAAQTSAPSAGAHTLGIDAGAFVKALEGSSGKRAVDAQKRLKVLFDGEPKIDALLEASRRIADSTGKNFSGTAGAAEVMSMPGLLGKVAEGAKSAAGVVAPLYGLRTVANKAATPAANRAIPLLEAPTELPMAARVGLAIGGGEAGREVTDTPLEIDITGGRVGTPAEIAQQEAELVELRRQAAELQAELKRRGVQF